MTRLSPIFSLALSHRHLHHLYVMLNELVDRRQKCMSSHVLLTVPLFRMTGLGLPFPQHLNPNLNLNLSFLRLCLANKI